MAKNKSGEAKADDAAGTAAPAAAEAAPAKEPKKPKEPKEGKAKGAPAGDQPTAEKPAATGEAAPAGEQTSAKKKGKQPGKSPRRGKKLREKMAQLQQKIAKEGVVPVKRAIQMLKQAKRAKFDETVEIHMALGIDTAQSDQMVRGSVSLPHGIGKTVRVVVFCQGDNIGKAKDAGADFAGADDLIEKIQKENWLDFDIALATQDLMGKVSRLGKVLGPRGLMPTPKAGTVIPATSDVAAAVKEFKAGKVEYRADKGGNVHAGVGKLSFEDDKLASNIHAFVEQIRSVKPSGVKGNYIKSVTLSATVSAGVPVSV
ncbi:MAG: 50S ribosomal protein L1 [Planctomycetia bacterium]|nr:50S ribosomal protein L1 [Planctomycetia bacterium]